MSDTQPNDAFSTEKLTRNLNGSEVPCTLIRFGAVEKPRTILIRDTMGPGDYLDAIEVYGGTKSDSAEGLAMVAFRLIDLDDKPVPPFRDRKDVHSYLNRVGNDGIAAIARASGVERTRTAEQTMDTVGN